MKLMFIWKVASKSHSEGLGHTWTQLNICRPSFTPWSTTGMNVCFLHEITDSPGIWTAPNSSSQSSASYAHIFHNIYNVTVHFLFHKCFLEYLSDCFSHDLLFSTPGVWECNFFPTMWSSRVFLFYWLLPITSLNSLSSCLQYILLCIFPKSPRRMNLSVTYSTSVTPSLTALLVGLPVCMSYLLRLLAA